MNIFKIALFAMLIFSYNPASSEVIVGEESFAELGKNLNGEKVMVTDYKGKVVIITFWATWCGPCMKELPILSGIQKRVGAKNLQVVAINFYEGIKFFKKISSGLSDNPIIFAFDRHRRAIRKYGVKAIPHMIIVDRNGRVYAQHIGYDENKLPELIEEINSVLSQNEISRGSQSDT